MILFNLNIQYNRISKVFCILLIVSVLLISCNKASDVSSSLAQRTRGYLKELEKEYPGVTLMNDAYKHIIHREYEEALVSLTKLEKKNSDFKYQEFNIPILKLECYLGMADFNAINDEGLVKKVQDLYKPDVLFNKIGLDFYSYVFLNLFLRVGDTANNSKIVNHAVSNEVYIVLSGMTDVLLISRVEFIISRAMTVALLSTEYLHKTGKIGIDEYSKIIETYCKYSYNFQFYDLELKIVSLLADVIGCKYVDGNYYSDGLLQNEVFMDMVKKLIYQGGIKKDVIQEIYKKSYRENIPDDIKKAVEGLFN